MCEQFPFVFSNIFIDMKTLLKLDCIEIIKTLALTTLRLFLLLFLQVNAHISFHGHRDSVKFFVTVPGSMDKTSSVSSPKLSATKAESTLFTSGIADEEKSWLVISGGEGYIDFRTGDNIEGGENIGGPEDIPSKLSSAENSHIMVWQVTGE